MHSGHWGGERIHWTCWPSTDDEPLRYEFGAPPFLKFLWIYHSIRGRHNEESLFWQRIPTATSTLNAIFVDDGQLESILSQLLYAKMTLSPVRLVLKVTLFSATAMYRGVSLFWGVLTRLD